MNETQPPKEFEADATAGTASAAVTASSPQGAPDSGAAKLPPQAPVTPRRQALSRWLGAGLVVAVIIIVALAANLRFQQQQLNDFGREASRRLDEAAAYAQQAREQAQAAQNMAQSVERRLQDLEASARQVETQQQALEHAWNELVVGEQNSILVDVEQSLLLAAEQLQLAGRVPSAIAALQLAEARLARSGRPTYRTAQQAIARDLKNLQALPYTDFGQLATQIDRMLADVASFPLMTPGLGDSSQMDAQKQEDAAATVAPQAAPTAGGQTSGAGEATAIAEEGSANNESEANEEWWREAWESSTAWAARTRDLALTELRRFVEVRRIDSAEAFMLSADQADILRANLSLRLIEARMAMLDRVNELWTSNLEEVAAAVRQYGEPRSPITRRLLRDLDELLSVEPAPTLPTLNDSLRAVRALLATIETEPALILPQSEPETPEAADETAASQTSSQGPESTHDATAPETNHVTTGRVSSENAAPVAED